MALLFLNNNYNVKIREKEGEDNGQEQQDKTQYKLQLNTEHNFPLKSQNFDRCSP